MQTFNYTQVKNLTDTGPDLCLCYTGVNPVGSLFKQLSLLGIQTNGSEISSHIWLLFPSYICPLGKNVCSKEAVWAALSNSAKQLDVPWTGPEMRFLWKL